MGNFETDDEKKYNVTDDDNSLRSEIRRVFEEFDNEESSIEEHRNLGSGKKIIGAKYIIGLPINVIRYLFIPCVLAFLIYRNLNAIFASGLGISTLLHAIPLCFFSSVAVYLSFEFLKVQITSKAKTSDEKNRISQLKLSNIIFRRGSTGSPYFLKRQNIIFELFAGLMTPTLIFILIFSLMNMMNVFGSKIVYVSFVFIFILALINHPASVMRSKAVEEINRLG